jgi:dual specificity phosphatase 12
MNDIRIVTPFVYIGGVRSIDHSEWMISEGITHVLKLYPDEPYWPDRFIVHDLPMDDGVHISPMILQDGVSFIEYAIRDGGKVLVVCGLGISRSAAFVLAYLVGQGYDLHDAFRFLRQSRPEAWPAPQLWESLIAYCHAPYTLRDVYTWLVEKSSGK